MYNIAIVEDEEHALKRFKHQLERYKEQNHQDFQLFSFTNAINLLTNYAANYDIVFMDIELPHLNGMEAAAKLREQDADVLLIFITNMAQYAVQGYSVQAYDFIVKPLQYYDFEMKMNRAISHLNRKRDDVVTINAQDGIMRVSVSDITYVEVCGHQLLYHLTDRVLLSRGHKSLNAVEQDLKAFHLMRCNNCYLVNPLHITKVTGSSVFVGEEELAISRPKRKAFLNDLANYFEGGK